ncbi:MAG TPA: hypothetical protein VHQ24_16020 [Lachnospiraceae bacterium]|nr:hypothetical protein [Lachnospiraceae bacterium]
MKKNTFTNFMLCGLSGWCMECFWTGLSSIVKHNDRELTCHTSVWMFPIYGMAAFLKPVCKLVKNTNAIVRGGVYTICIFATEFFTGNLLKKYQACPWDYSKSKVNYKGVIRFDYAPLWFIVGLFYEKILLGNKKTFRQKLHLFRT